MTAIGIHVCGGFEADRGHFSRYARYLSGLERQEMEARSGIKHARFAGSATCFAMLAARPLRELLHSDRLGIICTGGPSFLSASAMFVERARLAGSTLVNPLQFPFTLCSASATTVAAVLGAHQFAFSAGHDRLAFFEALEQARTMLVTGAATNVMVLAAVGNDKVVDEHRIRANMPRPIIDTSIGFGLTATLGGTSLHLLDIWFDDAMHPSSIPVYSAEWTGDDFTCDFATPVHDGEALGASGALICVAAIQQHLSSNFSPSSPFAVRLRSDGRSAIVCLQTCVI